MCTIHYFEIHSFNNNVYREAFFLKVRLNGKLHWEDCSYKVTHYVDSQ